MVLYSWAEVSAVSINKILASNHTAVVFLHRKIKIYMFSIEKFPKIFPLISKGMHMQNGLYSSAITLILSIGHRCAYLHRC